MKATRVATATTPRIAQVCRRTKREITHACSWISHVPTQSDGGEYSRNMCGTSYFCASVTYVLDGLYVQLRQNVLVATGKELSRMLQLSTLLWLLSMARVR